MIVKPVEREELRKHMDELFRLLSCPSDDLSDVCIPASGLYGESIYNISYRQMVIPILNVKLIADLPEDGRQYILHHISVNIPRFLVNESVEIPFVQRLWTEKLCELGKLFPLCLGSADMDQSHPNGFSAFDRANGDICLSDRIPGYAWAMLVNATQRKRIDVPESGQIPGFYKTVVFDNGNLFFQKTPDMRFMTWEDCHSLREFFKPSLAPAPLEHPYTTTFPTYRAGFLPEEIDFDGKLKPWSDFAVRHEDGEAF